MDGLLMQYADKFEDNFPLMYFRGVDDEEIEKMILKALETGKPVEVEYEKGATY